jgi:Phage minor capsid protein 2
MEQHEILLEQAMMKLVKIYDTAENQILESIYGADLVTSRTKLQTLKQIKETLMGLQSPASDVMMEYTGKEWKSGIKAVDKALKGVNLAGGFNVVDKKAISLISGLGEIQEGAVAGLNSTLSNAYANIESSLSLVSQQVRSELVSELGKRGVLGEARKKISRALLDKLNTSITGMIIMNKNGKPRQLSLSTLMEGIVQNAMTVAHANSTITRALELDQDLVIVSTHSNPSPMCEKWQGKILSITGQTPGYTLLDKATFKSYKTGGIFHRRCRHSLSVYIPTDIKFKVWVEDENNENEGIGKYVEQS